MAELLHCYYQDCYYNNNIENICQNDDVTLDFTGTCENITHCDEYSCESCDMRDFCTKDKKQQFEDD